MKTTMGDVTRFYTTLVNWGGTHFVDEDYKIHYEETGKPVKIKVNKPVDIVVLHNAMKRGEHTFFNPLNEVEGHNAERRWFMTELNNTFGRVTKLFVLRIIQLTLAEEDDENEPCLEALSLAAPYVDTTNARMVKAISKIPERAFLRAVFNEKTDTIKLVSDIFKDKTMAKYNLPKKTLALLRDILRDTAGTDDISTTFSYSAKELNMPRIECAVNIMTMFSETFGEAIEKVLPLKFYAEELRHAIPRLTSLRKNCGWAVSDTIANDRELTNKPKAQAKVAPTGMATYTPGKQDPLAAIKAMGAAATSGPRITDSGPRVTQDPGMVGVPGSGMIHPQGGMTHHGQAMVQPGLSVGGLSHRPRR